MPVQNFTSKAADKCRRIVLFCLIKNSFCCITSFWLLRIIKKSCKKSWLNFVSLSIIIVASGISCMTTKLHWKENNNHWANSCGLNFSLCLTSSLDASRRITWCWAWHRTLVNRFNIWQFFSHNSESIWKLHK